MSLLRKIFVLLLACQGVLGTMGAAPVDIDLDAVIDWNGDFLDRQKLEQLMSPADSAKKGTQRKVGNNDYVSTHWADLPEKNLWVSLFKNEMQVKSVTLIEQNSVFHACYVYLFTDVLGPEAVTKLVDRMKQEMGEPAIQQSSNIVWERQGWIAGLRMAPGMLEIRLMNGKTHPPLPKRPEQVKVAVDLDYLLNVEALWKCTADAFAKIYRPKTEIPQELPPQFEWLNADRSRARFSRQMAANLEAELRLFAKSVKVEEAIVEFADDRAVRVTISLYNRGDAGDISAEQFDQLYKSAGKAMGQILKVAPLNISNTVTSAVKTVSWQWRSPIGIALLEHNDFKADKKVGRPEFLRLKLANPEQADWSIGKLSGGVQRMALMKNITKTPSGDVYIAGVPMVDQGAKGYCVAASCQRLFEYMRIPCDQHEIAQLVNVDADSGANIFSMQKSLAKIDGHYKVAFKPFINPEIYYSTAGKRRVSQRQFSVIIKEHVDKAVPLLWALELGKHPEEPSLPNGGQVRGGHMRMIIGYNTAKREVIFTDSWGAGHELKRMSEFGAYEATLGLYSMSPRGL